MIEKHLQEMFHTVSHIVVAVLGTMESKLSSGLKRTDAMKSVVGAFKLPSLAPNR